MRLLTILILSLLPLFSTACATVGQSRVGIQNFNQVSPALYRGAQPNQAGIATLAQYHVKTIINLRDSDDAQEAKMVRDAGMTYLHLPLNAGNITPADANRFLALLAAAPAPAFVHCLVGRDRTGLAVAAYRLKIQGWTSQAALQDLYAHGHFWLVYPKLHSVIAQLALPPQLTKMLQAEPPSL